LPDDISPNKPDKKAQIQAWRHQIHAEPEMAFKEFKTSDLVAETLEAAGIEVHRGLAGTGVVGVLKSGKGPSIGLRADMDALPIKEATGCSYASTHDGVMHACGHDGHTAMLLGAALDLAENPNFQGNIYLIFQPAEENEGGGTRMVEEGLFKQFPCDAIFALHNWPGLGTGRIAVQPGPMMASYDRWEITLSGKGGHAAMPEQTRDPMPVAAELTLALQTLVSRRVSPHERAVLSVTKIEGGDTWNVIPEEVELWGCVRCFNETLRTQIEAEFHQIVNGITSAHGMTARINYRKDYPATINTPEEAEFAAQIARELVGEEKVDTESDPSMASEDFAVMLQEVPGAYIWLGIGEDAARLHTPNYDFNDDVLVTGSELLAELARGWLAR
tara:strand:- start:49175 stop:50338 length:1164 start_codon:yes stop_codon:yes gene_type:complete